MLKPEDIMVDTYRPSKRSGLRVGVDYGVKVTHKPTGIFVVEDSERSQHRNRAIALQKLEKLVAEAQPAPMSDDNRKVAYAAADKLRKLGYRWDDGIGDWVESASPAPAQPPHVQNPAEIEHVAGDVSKNGAEVNMMDLIDAYAEARHVCGCHTYNAKTAKARANVVAALRTQQPAPATQQAGEVSASIEQLAVQRYKVVPAHESMFHRWAVVAGDGAQQLYIGREVECENMARKFAGAFLDGAFYQANIAPTPPAQAEDSVTAPADGANWQDISTAPKDGTRFVAVGNNYGLYSEKQHTCIAQWFRGCWMEVSDWNEASELKYLTHWMPLPPPPGSAASATEDSVTAPAGEAEESEFLRVVAAHAPTDSVLEDAARWQWLADYLTGERTDLDEGIVACATIDALRQFADAARKQGGST